MLVEGKFALGTILAALIPKDSENLDSKYLYIYLSYYKDLILVPLMKGSANVSLTIKSLGTAEIHLPSIEKQRKIIDLVTKIEGEKKELDHTIQEQKEIVQLMRERVLQLAVQGKLVQQDSSDEHASVLLEKIQVEKERLINEGKVKKEKQFPPLTEDEIPFELPITWQWVRLGYILHSTDAGKSPDCIATSVQGDEWGVIKTTAIQKNSFWEEENKVLPEDFNIAELYKININDILITRAGPKNRVGIVCCVNEITKNIILSDKTIRLRLSDDLISHKYISLAMNSQVIRTFIEEKMTGMAESQVNISQSNMRLILIPIPPLAEQLHIVQKVDQLMSLCDELEKRIEKSKKYSEKLMEAMIRDSFVS